MGHIAELTGRQGRIRSERGRVAIGENMANCPNCGASISPDTTRCRKCGSAVEPQAPSVPPTGVAPPPVQVIIQTGASAVPPDEPYPTVQNTGKSRLTAGLLGLFLGVFGIHRFYLGYAKIGAIQMASTVVLCFLPGRLGALGVVAIAIWGLVEGVMILTGSIDRDAQGRPLTD